MIKRASDISERRILISQIAVLVFPPSFPLEYWVGLTIASKRATNGCSSLGAKAAGSIVPGEVEVPAADSRVPGGAEAEAEAAGSRVPGGAEAAGLRLPGGAEAEAAGLRLPGGAEAEAAGTRVLGGAEAAGTRVLGGTEGGT